MNPLINGFIVGYFKQPFRERHAMDELIEYLTSVPAWYMATCEGDQPHVRPFSFAMREGDTLWFCTATNKDVYKQLVENPKFELSAWKPGHGWVILTGKASMVDTAGDEIRKAGYEHMTALGETYEDCDDPRLTFFSLAEGTAKIADIDGSEREIKL